MADLRFDYETFQTLIGVLESVRSVSETLGYVAPTHPDSENDPLAEHHLFAVRGQDSRTIIESMTSSPATVFRKPTMRSRPRTRRVQREKKNKVYGKP